MSGLWCASLGFSNRRLIEAAQRQYEKIGFYHTFNHKTADIVIELAERLTSIAPIPKSRAYFATSGSEATETMVKLSWVYHAMRGEPGRRKIITRQRAFHGSTIVAASMCGISRMQDAFGLPLPGFLHTLCPDPYREKRADEDEAAFVARLAAELEHLIQCEDPGTIAAFVAEPIMGAGGVVVSPAGYFAAIQEVLDRHGILCLADEIICGFGRTGNWFGSQTTGMRPSMMTLAKGLSSSYFPISAVILSEPIYEAVAAATSGEALFGHGFTNSGHPVGAAVALEAIRIYEEMDVIPHVRAIGALLRARLEEMAASSRIVGHVRGAGLMLAMELAEDRERATPFPPEMRLGARFDEEALRNGLIIRPLGDIIACCPPLIIDEAGIHEIADKLALTLRRVEAQVLSERAA